ncbi:hypothetical protein A4X13_0g5628 [Tilletia indica]|uniref:Uncharacterized protein n=1 Tax=Tilletia indica TaxID=43049 RepID=A0A177THL5_9BASI|nr:hypothetical protein A4X13_0g5628 [Tilletia indica]
MTSANDHPPRSSCARFIAGPFAPEDVQSKVGPFHTSPLHIVTKTNEHGEVLKHRVVYDASYPKQRPGRPPPPVPSLNSYIRKEDYPCDWLTVMETKVLLRTLPPWARVAGFDLSDAFQQIPNRPSERTLLCLIVAGLVYVWLVGIFGTRSIGGIFGQVCDLTCHFIEVSLPDIILRHYVDDFLCVDLAPPTSPLANRPWDTILQEVKALGWQIHPKKQFPWCRRFDYLGIVWDLDASSASLTPSKQAKFRAKILAALANPLVTEKEVASIIGSCQHACVLAVERRSRLNLLYAFRNTFRGSHSYTTKYLTTAATRELNDWAEFFARGPVSCSLAVSYTPFHLPLFTDASDFALGVVLGNSALSIPLPPDYCSLPGINIGVGEAWAYELGVRLAIAAGARDCMLVINVDNQGVVFGVRRGRSRNFLVNQAIGRAAEIALAANVEVSIRYVRSADNLADAPSRGDWANYSPLNLPYDTPWIDVLTPFYSQ